MADIARRATIPADWSTERSPAGRHSTWAGLARRAATFLLASAALWIALDAAYLALPFVRSGGAVVGEKQRDYGLTPVFPATATIRIVAFGNSKTLAGLKPSVLDETVGPGAYSVNMAIPGESGFMSELEAMLRAGNRPTHIFLQFSPVVDADRGSWLDRLRDSHRIVTWLVPFRTFPRDLTLFLFDSFSRGGPLKSYRDNANQVRRIQADRGYYFIKSQSRYPGDRLPDGYSLPTDRPERRLDVAFDTRSAAFRRIMELSAEYGFEVVRVPVAYREGEAAPPGPTPPPEVATGRGRFRWIGPDYLSYPVALFSDPVHLNPAGAERYSADLARLFKAGP